MCRSLDVSEALLIRSAIRLINSGSCVNSTYVHFLNMSVTDVSVAVDVPKMLRKEESVCRICELVKHQRQNSLLNKITAHINW